MASLLPFTPKQYFAAQGITGHRLIKQCYIFKILIASFALNVYCLLDELYNFTDLIPHSPPPRAL